MSLFSLPGTFAYEATFGAISRDLQRPEKIKLMYEASYTTMKVIERKFNAGLK